MQVLVSRDHRGSHFRPCEELAEIAGDEISSDFVTDEPPALRVDLGDANPVDLRKARRDFATDEADAARADDRETDSFRLFLAHAAACLDSGRGRETGSLRSAEISAA